MYIVNCCPQCKFFSNQCQIRTKGMYCANWYYMHGTILIEEAGLALSSCRPAAAVASLTRTKVSEMPTDVMTNTRVTLTVLFCW
jgi:hypothetical protein